MEGNHEGRDDDVVGKGGFNELSTHSLFDLVSGRGLIFAFSVTTKVNFGVV